LSKLSQKLADLGSKLETQQTQFSEARNLFINSSLTKVEKENDELRQSVRIADNELRIMIHEEEVKKISY